MTPETDLEKIESLIEGLLTVKRKDGMLWEVEGILDLERMLDCNNRTKREAVFQALDFLSQSEELPAEAKIAITKLLSTFIKTIPSLD